MEGRYGGRREEEESTMPAHHRTACEKDGDRNWVIIIAFVEEIRAEKGWQRMDEKEEEKRRTTPQT